MIQVFVFEAVPVLENSLNVFGKEEATFQKGILSYSL